MQVQACPTTSAAYLRIRCRIMMNFSVPTGFIKRLPSALVVLKEVYVGGQRKENELGNINHLPGKNPIFAFPSFMCVLLGSAQHTHTHKETKINKQRVDRNSSLLFPSLHFLLFFRVQIYDRAVESVCYCIFKCILCFKFPSSIYFFQ